MAADIKVVLRLLRGMPRSGHPAERLEAFYAPQARAYDDFRERLLHGRRELIEQLDLPSEARIIELGAGTGRNLDYLGQRVATCGSIELVDLCPALLAEARKRAERHANVRVVEADAATYRPDAPVDIVLFSYSLTMIPDWRLALRNAAAMLKPGGRLAAVDFTISAQQGALASRFWRLWFQHDGVRLSREHGAVLRELFPHYLYRERRAMIPYLPSVLRVPYFLFIGANPHR